MGLFLESASEPLAPFWVEDSITCRERCSTGLICLALAGTARAQTAFPEQAVERGLSYVVTQDLARLGAGVAPIDLDGDPDCVLLRHDDGPITSFGELARLLFPRK